MTHQPYKTVAYVAGPYVRPRTWASKHPQAFRQLVAWSLIFFAFLSGIILLWPEKTSGEGQSSTLAPKTSVQAVSSPTIEATGVLTPKDSYQMHATAFSSSECHTTFCLTQVGKPRQYVVALNKKFGKSKKVFVPAYQQYYEVIGTTNQNTDIDFFMDSLEAAKEFGSKNLLVNILR